jgi:hypothetical protein
MGYSVAGLPSCWLVQHETLTIFLVQLYLCFWWLCAVCVHAYRLFFGLQLDVHVVVIFSQPAVPSLTLRLCGALLLIHPCYPLPLAQMVAGLRINNSSAWAAFDKMEEKVMALEAEADSAGLLAAPDRLEAQFAMLEGGTVEDELAALKQGRLAATSSASSSSSSRDSQQALGRPVSEVLVREPARQLDGIDAELEQLRKRARGQ